MTWRIWWYIAGRWCETMARRSVRPWRVYLWQRRAEKYFAKAGL
jgi:hypothetical protein